MREVKYKKVKRKDLNNLVSLRMDILKEVFSPIEDSITRLMWINIKNNNYSILKEGIKRDKIISYFAYDDRKIIGCGSVCFSKELSSPDNISGINAYIMNVYTKKEYTRKGIATNICNRLIEDAKKKNAEKIFLETSVNGEKLYYNLGFTTLKDYMKLGLLFSEEIMKRKETKYE